MVNVFDAAVGVATLPVSLNDCDAMTLTEYGVAEPPVNVPKVNKEILITIDDAFQSFYLEAWPYLKKNKIPFILFVSTEPVGKKGYMNWDQIREIEEEDFAFIGNHSHSHKYLVNFDFEKFKKDIDQSIKI